MAWTTNSPNSRIFQEWFSMVYQASATGWTGVDSDTMNMALFNNTTTPDATVAVGSTGFNTGVWVLANEVTDATNWVSGGRALAGKLFTIPTAGTFMVDANDLAGGGNVTLANVFGGLIYDNTISGGTVAKQGMSYHYFGGAQGVTAGTFTVVFNVNGINRVTV